MHDKNERAFRRDKFIHKAVIGFMAVLLCVVAYLGFEIIKPKPPAAPIEDNLAEPTFYIAPDNRKKLELKNDQN